MPFDDTGFHGRGEGEGGDEYDYPMLLRMVDFLGSLKDAKGSQASMIVAMMHNAVAIFAVEYRSELSVDALPKHYSDCIDLILNPPPDGQP